VFARGRSRIRRAIVEIDEASSGLLQLVAMAFRGDQHSHFVHRHRDPLIAYTARGVRYMVGSTYRSLAICQASIY